ncbi:MAG TPA: long-chain-fatty-acid--CoA ligase [Terriglobia bacterium]|nr:long-chain-fatty-acid--CoA ligase [Terriglobia bacterium]
MDLIQDVTTLAGLPRVLSKVHGTKAALIVQDVQTTFDALETGSNRIANALIQAGVVPGDRVAFLGRDSSESVLLLFGAAKAKAVTVNINWRLGPDEIAYILADAAPRFFFVEAEFARILPKTFQNEPALLELVVFPPGGLVDHVCTTNGGTDDSTPALEYAPTDVVAQIYTSGTTGHPKGVRLPNTSFFALSQEMHASCDTWVGWTDESVSLICVPAFHIAGLWQLVRGLALGCTSIVARTFEPAAILRAIPKYRVTVTGMVPSMLAVMLTEPGCLTADFSSLKAIVYGGSPISAALLEKAMKVFGCGFYQIYGLTETGNMAACLRAEDHFGPRKRLRSAGKPLPGVEVKIIDEDGNVGPGNVGQIAIKSPAAMAGYWNLPEATRETLVDGWVMTGDAGYMDEEGFIYVCDRIKDMIISAGENIYPLEIENVIRSHTDVVDAAVIGVPNDVWGEAAKALIVRRPGSSIRATDIIRHIRMQLAEFKVPKTVDFVDQLPRNAAGKILKTKLREPFWQGRERRVS